MKKIIIAIAILLANGLFISCTDLDENGPEELQLEIQNTGGEDGQTPIGDDEED